MAMRTERNAKNIEEVSARERERKEEKEKEREIKPFSWI